MKIDNPLRIVFDHKRPVPTTLPSQEHQLQNQKSNQLMYALIPERVVLEPSTLEIDLNTTNLLSSILQEEKTSSIAFQSVLVAAIQIIERVREDEIAVASAAISLGQRQILSQMLASVDALLQTLHNALNDQGARILDLQPRGLAKDEAKHSWWFCLAGAIETLNAGTDWITLIVSGQDQESPCRKLANVVTGFLEKHHTQLNAEIKH